MGVSLAAVLESFMTYVTRCCGAVQRFFLTYSHHFLCYSVGFDSMLITVDRILKNFGTHVAFGFSYWKVLQPEVPVCIALKVEGFPTSYAHVSVVAFNYAIGHFCKNLKMAPKNKMNSDGLFFVGFELDFGY